MTAEDIIDGWWDAPPGTHWTCPECGVSSAVELWTYCELDCDLCGDHEGRQCPECWDTFDHVWGGQRIADATAGKS